MLTAAAAVSLAFSGVQTALADVPLIAGQTTISGHTGYAFVRLTAPLKLGEAMQQNTAPKAEFHSGSPLAMVFLRAEQPNEFGQHPRICSSNDPDTEGSFGGVDLPAGIYRLFLYDPQGAASVTVKWPAAQGTLSLSPAFSVAPQQTTAAPHPSATWANTVVVGKTISMASDGFVRVDITSDFPGVLKARRSEWCLADPESGSDDSTAFEPGCPGSIDDFSSFPLLGDVSVLDVSPNDSDEFHLTGVAGPGPFGVGGNLSYSEGAPKVDALYRWVSVGETGTPTTLSPPKKAAKKKAAKHRKRTRSRRCHRAHRKHRRCPKKHSRN